MTVSLPPLTGFQPHSLSRLASFKRNEGKQKRLAVLGYQVQEEGALCKQKFCKVGEVYRIQSLSVGSFNRKTKCKSQRAITEWR